MTVQRLYFCNLCKKMLDREKPAEALGLYWEGNSKLVLRRPWTDIEHHICIDCFDAIRKIEP